MKLTLKLSFVWISVLTLFLMAQASLQLGKIDDFHIEDLREEIKLQASILQQAVDTIWATGQQKELESFLENANQKLERIELAWFIYPKDQLQKSITEKDQKFQIQDSKISTTVPLLHQNIQIGELTVSKTFSLMDRPVRLIYEESIWEIMLFVFVAAFITIISGYWWVGRPIEIMKQQTQEIEEGHFDQTPPLRGKDELGSLSRIIGRLAEQLRHYKSEVKREKQSRTKTLDQLRHADRLSTVGKLASSIAHELGTPLNVISGRAQMIRMDPENTSDVLEQTLIIEEQVERMSDMIHNLLNFSRNKGLKPSHIDLAELFEHALVLIEPIAEQNAVSIHVEKNVSFQIKIDEKKILQVLTNMMVNSIQAMPSGGKLNLRYLSTEIADPPLRHADPGKFVCLKIQDTGVGMSPKKIKKIFKPFFTTKKEGEGTGLGLSVCDEIIKEHGGWIEVESEEFKGSCFKIFLPIKGIEA